MTIKPGASWGRQVPRPDNLVTVHSDVALVAAISMPESRPIALGAGDLARTLGVSTNTGRETISEFTIDLLEVRLDGMAEPIVACAHVVARPPWHRGHGLTGAVLAVMNAEFIGDWDVAPRGHPNDGRAEVFEVDAAMSVRHRLTARRRMRNATHIPHPQIATRSIRSATWNFQRPLEVIIDGQRAGRVSTLSVAVVPDAATVYV
jgi:hypothetical protein